VAVADEGVDVNAVAANGDAEEAGWPDPRILLASHPPLVGVAEV